MRVAGLRLRSAFPRANSARLSTAATTDPAAAALSPDVALGAKALVCDEALREPLVRVSYRVSRALLELRAMRAESAPWTSALDALQTISQSPRRHLFRPQLVLLGRNAGLSLRGASSSERAATDAAGVAFAAGVELQHLFMLVHDDVMDHGTIRRGLPTVGVALSRPGLVRADQVGHLATLVGDVVHVKAVDLLVQGALGASAPGALTDVFASACRAGAAEFDDLVGWEGVERAVRSSGMTLTEIQARHASDIASNHGFAAPLASGLWLGAGGVAPPAAVASACAKWASLAGRAFLALDDVADLVEDPSHTGKDSLQDVREGRLSQPLFNLRRLASEEEWRHVRGILGSGAGSTMTLFDRRTILDAISRHRLVTRTLEAAVADIRAASAALAGLDAEPKAKELKAGLETFQRGLFAEADHLQGLAKGR